LRTLSTKFDWNRNEAIVLIFVVVFAEALVEQGLVVMQRLSHKPAGGVIAAFAAWIKWIKKIVHPANAAK
jgi:hypothetical protein